MKKLFSFCLVIVTIASWSLPALALETQFSAERVEDIFLNKQAITKGFNFISGDKLFLLAVTPKLFTREVQLTLSSYKTDGMDFPDGWSAVSKIYEFAFSGAEGVNYQQSTVMQISSESDIMNLRRIFIWSDETQTWKEVTATGSNAKALRAKVKLSGGKYVVLESQKIMQFGAASWYKYKNCDCAASPDYPKGTMLKVTNLDNGRSIIVKVNDWGPERDKHPDRVIDLDKTAFKKLGSLSRGLLKNVKVEPAS